MKQAVISPSMMYLLYPLNGDIKGYPQVEFMKDLVDEVRHYFCDTRPLLVPTRFATLCMHLSAAQAPFLVSLRDISLN